MTDTYCQSFFGNQKFFVFIKMRADRLLSLMMLLQTQGKKTAKELADELEVTQRTIYRDIDALSGSGVPVYADGGPGGGYALLDNYRTSLTGLNTGEIRALFMLAIPSPITDLGGSQELKAAFLKLTSTSLDRQNQIDFVRQRLHMDATGWFKLDEPVPYLKVVQEGVWKNQELSLSYRPPEGTLGQRTVWPYGLVAKAGIWYLVAKTEKGMRVYRMSRIEAAELTEVQFIHPEGFDLADFWTKWASGYEANLSKYPVRLLIGPDLAPILHNILGKGVQPLIEQALPNSKGWRVLDYTFEREEEAKTYVLGMGASVEVIAPEALRIGVIKMAADIVAHYARSKNEQ